MLLLLIARRRVAVPPGAAKTDTPVTYANDDDHFKYGSISSDVGGIPYWIWATMPEVCRGNLPGGYASLGVIQEPGRIDADRLFDAARRLPRSGRAELRAVPCDDGARRAERGAASPISAAPAQQLDLMGYFRFLFDCGRNPAFTKANVIAAIGRHNDLSLFERTIYGIAVPQVKKGLIEGGGQFDSIVVGRPPWGPGRVDTFNPYKVLVFHDDMTKDKSIGTADFMSIWDQNSREGMWLHWDGNNDSLDERNLSAAIGAGATPLTLSKDVNLAGRRPGQALDHLPAGAEISVPDRLCQGVGRAAGL